VFALCVLLARKTRFGRYVYAIGGGEKVAALSGVPVRRYKLYAFMLSGLLVSIGGLMLMFRVQSGAAEVGEPFLLLSIAAIVMGGTPLTGGVGGPHRTLLGVLLISVLTNGMSVANVHPFLQIVVQGVVVIIAVALTIDRRKLTLVK
jgi:ribose transport system permease protein